MSVVRDEQERNVDRWRVVLRGSWLAALLAAGCCRPASALAPQQVCILGDGGVPASGQPVALQATVYGTLVDGTCAVTLVADTLTLVVSGTSCPAGGTAPVVPMSLVRCDVGPLDAGAYVVNAGSGPTVLGIGAAPAAGAISSCR